MILSLAGGFVVGMVVTLLMIMMRDTRKIMRDTASMAADIRDIALMTSRVTRQYDRVNDLHPIDSD